MEPRFIYRDNQKIIPKTKKMKKLLKITFGLAFIVFAGSTQAQSKMTEAQKEEARARYEAYQEKLALTDEQAPRIEEINLAFYEGLSELRNSDASRLSKYRKFKDLDSKRDKDMKAVLTDDQYETYQEFKKENREEFKSKRKNG